MRVWVIWVVVASVVLGLGLLSAVALKLYRGVKHFSTSIKTASATIGELTNDLEIAQRDSPPKTR